MTRGKRGAGPQRKLRKKDKKRKRNLAKYVTRARALQMLQLPVEDFRKICILKGIYPRDPRKKYKGHEKLYYSTKDIKFLMKEPVLQKFRQYDTFKKRLKKAVGRGEYSNLKSMGTGVPVYKIDHLVKERYPTFTHALKSLDDVLTMVNFFSSMPLHTGISTELQNECTNLMLQFYNYVIKTNALRKVFVSIKGYYFQIEINGELITWIVPHNFTQKIPKDVNFNIMITFVQFYKTTLTFINHRLYHELGMVYPPKFDDEKIKSGEIYETVLWEQVKDSKNKKNKKQKKKNNNKNVSQKKEKEIEIENESGDESDDEKENDKEKEKEKLKYDVKKVLKKEKEFEKKKKEERKLLKENEKEKKKEKKENKEQEMERSEKMENDKDEQFHKQWLKTKIEEQRERAYSELFKKCVFYISREVPAIIKFCILSFGGKIIADEQSNQITHQITDRKSIKDELIVSRNYLQPQWVFDSINELLKLPLKQYKIGEKLPVHLSPFVKYEDRTDLYIPERRKELNQLQQDYRSGKKIDDYENELEMINKKEIQQLKKEESGVVGDEDDDKEAKERKRKINELGNRDKKLSKQGGEFKEGVDEEEEKKPEHYLGMSKDDLKMAKTMMKKKTRKLFNKIQHLHKKRDKRKNRLEKKRDQIKKNEKNLNGSSKKKRRQNKKKN
ncbi:pescadillo [Anaeramoeba flamelloides]|uniref:Pescadillo homolog n=1 Tax=Anaeramoeba flamelloides TaxID=1746091 RepID=A0AAV7Z993_9EUKA|nr:pescadillo [Anaeramoeba flamelloides]